MDKMELIYRAEKDFEFQVGELCVLNSGSPVFVVGHVLKDGRRVLSSGEMNVSLIVPSLCLRPHSLLRILGARS
jgi:hypothetical protein